MGSDPRSKLIAISFALAAAGILACAGAILDALVPRDSVLGFLTWLAVLGFIVVGTVVGYTLLCDQCESHFDEQTGRSLNDGEPNHHEDDLAIRTAAASPQATEPRTVCDARTIPDALQPRSRGWYVPTLRGSVSRKDSARLFTTRAWHGQ
jgi:hypothetical protein